MDTKITDVPKIPGALKRMLSGPVYGMRSNLKREMLQVKGTGSSANPVIHNGTWTVNANVAGSRMPHNGQQERAICVFRADGQEVAIGKFKLLAKLITTRIRLSA